MTSQELSSLNHLPALEIMSVK